MSDTPEFSSKPLESEATPKKRLPRRVAPKAKNNTQEINRAISSIYEDDKGHLPNIKKIQIKKHHPAAKFFASVLFIGVVLALAAWAKFLFWPTDGFSDTGLEFTITGPETMALGATSTYTVAIRNNQAVAIKNLNLNIRYPAGFVFLDSSLAPQNAGHNEWTMGEIAANKKTTLTITGKTFGAPAEAQSWRALLDYQPANVNSEFQKTAILNTKFDASPFNIVMTGPDKATVGAEVEYTFKIENKTDWQPAKLELAFVPPAGFSITSSTPALAKNRWVLNLAGSSSTPLSEITLSLRGQFSNTGEANAIVKTALYLPVAELNQNVNIAESSLTTALAKNSVSFTTAVNGTLKDFSTHPGETLNVTINIKNTSATDISKGVVSFTLVGPSIGKQTLVDWQNITDPADGDIVGKQISDSLRQGQITWNSAQIPALAKIKAGAEINIDFRLAIKGADKVTLADFKENKITIASNLDYVDSAGAEQTLPGNAININLNSDLDLETRKTVSSAGGADKYDIKWIITNNFHPLKNVRLTADAYGDITFVAGTAPAGELKFDESKKTITWTVPEMPESVDVLALPFSITLNKKDPTQNLLVGKAHVTADDTITGETIDFLSDGVSLLQ